MNLLGVDAVEELIIMVDREGKLALQYHGGTDPQVIARVAFALERGAAALKAQYGIRTMPSNEDGEASREVSWRA